MSTGCMTRVGDMTMLSTRNVNLDRLDIDKLPQQKNITGEDSVVVLLGIPLGQPHLKNAVDNALDKGNGDLMTDVVLSAGGWSIFIIGQATLEVKGTVVKTRGN
jgi:hypothetical protein